MDEVPDLVEDQYDGGDSDADSDEGWEECMGEGEEEPCAVCICLFCDESFPSPELTFSHCQQKHDLSIPRLAQELRLDCFGYIKLINFVRTKRPSAPEVRQIVSHGQIVWDSDDFMKPVIEDDGLLQYDIDDLVSDIADAAATCDASVASTTLSAAAAGHHQLLSRVREVEERATQAEDRLQQALQDLDKMRLSAQNLVLSQTPAVHATDKAIEHLKDDEDDAYFDSYGHFNIHQEMLQDKVRTESYRDAISLNPGLFRDKVVLDVGCGTGILSMMAARAGAKLVIGVDMSDIIYQAIDIVKENGLEDKVKLIKGRMEDVELPVEKVDIIVSEWMGYLLLFESMLDSVLWARDRYLSPGGAVLPDSSRLYVAAIDDPEMYRDNVQYWDDVYGFKMSCMRDVLLKEASVEVIKPSRVVSEACVVKTVDICTCTTKDLEFGSPFTLPITKESSVNALVVYFDISFSLGEKEVKFSTGPDHTPTHWKQTVFLLESPIAVVAGDKIEGNFVCRKNRRDPRSLIVDIRIGDKTKTYSVQ